MPTAIEPHEEKQMIPHTINGQTIFITGGTGSFGNALVDYLKNTDIHFIVYSRDEKKQHDMYVSKNNPNVTYIVGDIRDRQKLIYSMKDVDYVFHAAEGL
jgi:UDP-glucose 4-epimerase